MENLQLSLHQHGAIIIIAVGLAKRANDYELRHLQDFIAGEMVTLIPFHLSTVTEINDRDKSRT
jgi:hypothetical protein